MPSITYDRWEIGMDRRKGRGVSDANKLWNCKNAYINTGWVPQKRPGLTKITTLESGTVGLVPHNGLLNTFYNNAGAGGITHAHVLFQANEIGSITAGAVQQIYDHEVFGGFLYIAAKFATSGNKHCYISGSYPNLITDGHCPNTRSIQRAASKIFAIDGDTVAYCATGDPTDWTTANNAGFLPTGIQSQGSETALALGLYNNLVTVFAIDNIQTWNVDPDPVLMSISEIVPNMGTIYPRSVGNVSGDIYFLSSMDIGYRSISTLALTQNLSDIDVGAPFDAYIRSEPKPTNDPISVWFQGGGQYWNIRDNKADVYTFSRTAKVSAWSYYEFPITIDAAAELNGVLYLRSGDDVYKVDPDAYEDDVAGGTAIEVDVEMNFQSLKKPGQEKLFIGADVACIGDTTIDFRYDPDNTSLLSESVTASDDSRRDGLIPVDLMATELAPRFRHSANEDWRLDLVNLYYEVLGV